MKILIIGAGGLGTVFATLLARAGCEVTLLIKPSQAPPLREWDNVLAVEGLLTAEVPIRIVTGGADAGAVDWLVILVKTGDTDAALAAAAGCRPQAVVSLQNGLAKHDRIADVFGAESVVGGLTMVQATKLAVGRARLNVLGNTWLGEPGGGRSPRVDALTEQLNAAELPATAVEDIVAAQWWKLIGMLTTSLTTSLARRDNASVFCHALLSEVYVDIAREVLAVAKADGANVTDPPNTSTPLAAWTEGSRDDFLAELQRMGHQLQSGGSRPLASMAQDVLGERRTEVEYVAGEVVRRAEMHAVQVPVLRTCYRLLRGLEDGFPDS